MLFWRLMTGDPPGPFDDPSLLLQEDILRNLHNVFNSRKGRLVGRSDYGLDDAEIFSKSPVRFAQMIKELIKEFEPRIDPDHLHVIPVELEDAEVSQGQLRTALSVHGKVLQAAGTSVHLRTTLVAEGAQVHGQVEAIDVAAGEDVKFPRRILVESEEE